MLSWHGSCAWVEPKLIDSEFVEWLRRIVSAIAYRVGVRTQTVCVQYVLLYATASVPSIDEGGGMQLS